MNERKRAAWPAFLAVMLLLGAVFYGAGRGGGGASKSDGTPESAIKNLIYDGLVDSMRRGDVNGYLNCFDDNLRVKLAESVKQQGKAAFAEELKASNAKVSGVAVSQVQVLNDRGSARVEWVSSQDYIDAQTMRFERKANRWQITEIDALSRSQMPVKYGTEVVPGLRQDEADAMSERPDGE